MMMMMMMMMMMNKKLALSYKSLFFISFRISTTART
jgi:hypothetical protein